MTWLLVTGAGLVVETVVIVALGRQAMLRSDTGESQLSGETASSGDLRQ